MYKNSNFKSVNGKDQIVTYIWDEVENPIAIIQIIHGMAEYMGRYDELAKELNKLAFIVVGEDHLGHGLSVSDGNYGHFGGKDSYKNLSKDSHKFTEIVKKEYGDELPYFILGHSMGSFITKDYMYHNKDLKINGVILEGTTCKAFDTYLALAFSKVSEKIYGELAKAEKLKKISSKVQNIKINKKKDKGSWLTRDQKIIDEYKIDKFCNFIFTNSGYSELLKLIIATSSKDWYEKYPKDVPTLVIAGTGDPVGAYGKRVKKVYEKLKAEGQKDIDLVLMKDFRHELHNEIGKEEFTEIINDWFKARI